MAVSRKANGEVVPPRNHPVVVTSRCMGVIHKVAEGVRVFFEGIHSAWQQPFIRNFCDGFLDRVNPLLEYVYPLFGRITPIFSGFGSSIQHLRICSCAGVIHGIAKLLKVIPKLSYRSGAERFFTAMKASYAVSIIVDSSLKLLWALESLKFSTSLGNMGYKTIEKIVKTTIAWSKPVGAVNWIFSTAILAVDINAIRKTKEFALLFFEPGFKKNPEKQDKLLDELRNDVLSKEFETNGEALREVFIKSSVDSRKIKYSALRGRIQSIIRNQKVKLALDAINLLATPLILTSFFHPAGFICLGAYGVGLIAHAIFRNISRYRFEKSVGMIDREGKVEPRGSAVVPDFFRWTLGRLSYHQSEPVLI